MLNNLPKTIDGYFKLLDPIENGFELFDYNEYKKLDNWSDSEVWTDSKALFVDPAIRGTGNEINYKN